jgi:hypothetical protein
MHGGIVARPLMFNAVHFRRALLVVVARESRLGSRR